MKSRRAFLGELVHSAGFMAVTSVAGGSLLAGCNENASSTPESTPAPVTPVQPDTPASTLAAGQFTHGTASGDPTATSIVLWTRAVPDDSIDTLNLRLTVAADKTMTRPLAQPAIQALKKFDYTTRIKIRDLQPDTIYYYKFATGNHVTETGSFRTLPAADNARPVHFAWMSCQDWSVNHWENLSLLLAEKPEFVVHLGDYIYETVGASFQHAAAEKAHGPLHFPEGGVLPAADGGGYYALTLADYRYLYKTYRSDPRLQALHQQVPMIAIWDDHEFSNDCWQDHETYTNANSAQGNRRLAATQAWAEYMPVDWTDIAFSTESTDPKKNIRLYRDFRIGQNMHLLMTDQRLFRSDHTVPEAVVATQLGHDPVNGSDAAGSRYFVPNDVLNYFDQTKKAAGQQPSILGNEQTRWFVDTLSASSAVWKVWGNEVTLNRMHLDFSQMNIPDAYKKSFVLNADCWDGFPTSKQQLLTTLADRNISGLVAITGDLHAFQTGIVRKNDAPVTAPAVLVDFVGAGISSSSFYSYLRDASAGTPLAALTSSVRTFDTLLQMNNPDFRYLDSDAQGFATALVSPDQMVVTYFKTAPLNTDGSLPLPVLLKKTRFTLSRNSGELKVEDNV